MNKYIFSRGYASIIDAADKMSSVSEEVFYPNQEHVKMYNTLYEKYESLYHLFGKEKNVMQQLQTICSKSK